MNRADRATIQTALDHIPNDCQYHGTNIERTTGFNAKPTVCCDTGKPALARRQAETVLTSEANRLADLA
jgi:hypothetical protein